MPTTSKIQGESMNLTDTYAFTGTVTGAGGGDVRNLIIDPFFTQWPEGTSVAAVNNDEYGPALWRGMIEGSSPVIVTLSQSTDVPTVSQAGYKIPYAMKCLVTTADATVASGDAFYLEYDISGSELAQIHQQAFVISFWCKVKGATGLSGDEEICVACCNSAENRSFVQDVTITANDTWQKIEVVVPADTTGTFLFTPPDIGLRVKICLGGGSSFQGTSGAWASANDVATSNTDNLMNEVNDELHITAVQVELGTVATACHAPDINTIINALNYYIERLDFIDDSSQQTGLNGFQTSTTAALNQWPFKSSMRVQPAGTGSAASTFYSAHLNTIATGTSIAILGTNHGREAGRVVLTTGAVGAAGDGCQLLRLGTNTCFLMADARH